MSATQVSVNDLSIEYRHQNIFIPAVRKVSFDLAKGETLGIVGESGCGKTTLALSLMNLLPKNESRITSGSIIIDNQNVFSFTKIEWQKFRGKKIAMVFQDPFSALNPVLTIDYQIQECIIREKGAKDRVRARELLQQVQLLDSDRILDSYPHQLSGGQRQRVLIAMALAQNPEILIADEPTTALDVTVQAEIIKLLKQLQQDLHLTLIFVTHNLGLVKALCHQILVMYAGEIVEMGPTDEILTRPKQVYTKTLLLSVPLLCRS